jgi:transposase
MRVMSNGRVRRTEDEWRELISRFGKSGASLREFCRKEGLSAAGFQRWRAKLNGKVDRKDFVTVIPAAPVERSARPWVVEVTLPDGSRLRFQG